MLDMKERTNLSADIRDEGGSQKVMLHANYGARSLNLTIEVLDCAYVAANTASVEGDVAAFVSAVCQRAAADNSLPTSRITSD